MGKQTINYDVIIADYQAQLRGFVPLPNFIFDKSDFNSESPGRRAAKLRRKYLDEALKSASISHAFR